MCDSCCACAQLALTHTLVSFVPPLLYSLLPPQPPLVIIRIQRHGRIVPEHTVLDDEGGHGGFGVLGKEDVVADAQSDNEV